MEQVQPLTIGMKAPDFTENSTFGPISLSDYEGKWLVLFSHPGDFTPVCTTEFLAFAQHAEEFFQQDIALLGLSIDSDTSHIAWVQSIEDTTGVHIPFPVLADRMGIVARKYGMIAPDVDMHATIRSVFIIDPNGIIRAILLYPMTTGRNVPEVLRLVTALRYTDTTGSVTPAGWEPGHLGMVGAPHTVEEVQLRVDDPEELQLSYNDWYWCYRTAE